MNKIPTDQIRYGENAETIIPSDGSYVRCWNCGHICSTEREVLQGKSSRGGDGISVTTGSYVLNSIASVHYPMDDNADTTTVVNTKPTGVAGTSQRNTSLMYESGGLNFNGTTDYIDTNSSLTQVFRNSFSVNAWVTLPALPSSEAYLMGVSIDDAKVSLSISDSGQITGTYILPDGDAEILGYATAGGSGQSLASGGTVFTPSIDISVWDLNVYLIGSGTIRAEVWTYSAGVPGTKLGESEYQTLTGGPAAWVKFPLTEAIQLSSGVKYCFRVSLFGSGVLAPRYNTVSGAESFYTPGGGFVAIQANRKYSIYATGTSKFAQVLTSASIVPTSLHLITMTVDMSASEMKIYLDGVELASGVFGVAMRSYTGGNIFVGALNLEESPSGYFTGVISDFFIINKALAESDIPKLYDGTLDVDTRRYYGDPSVTSGCPLCGCLHYDKR